MRRFLNLGGVILAAVVLSACVPRAADAPDATRPPPDCYKYPGNPGYPTVRAAILSAFGPYGQAVTDKAGRVACCETGWGPGAGYPNAYYKGLFQLGPHVVAIRQYGGNWWDAYQNAAAARDLYVTRGNWSAWPVCQHA